MNRKLAILLPSLGDVLFVALFLSLSLVRGQRLLGDSATGAHIRAGEFMWNTLSVPKHDIFSFHSPALPWTAHEWLSQVIMALIHNAFGLTGIVIFFSCVIAASYFLLLKMCSVDHQNMLLALLAVCLVMVSSQIHWLARPHAFSFVLTVLWYYALDAYENGRAKSLLFLPFLMLIWVNLHGGFMFGFILLGVYFACNAARWIFETRQAAILYRQKLIHLGLIGLACVAVSLINPAGFEILLFPFKLVGDTYLMDHIQEYLSPNFHETMPFRYLLYLVILLFGLSEKRVSITEIALILLLTHMALYAVRYIPLFGIIAAPILVKQAALFVNSLEERWVGAFKAVSSRIAARDSASRGHLWPAIGVAAVVLLAATGQVAYKFDAQTKPVAAVDFLKRENLQGNMLNLDTFGDYLIYAAWPQYRVFVDGRQDLYGTERLREYDAVIWLAPGWEKIMEKYKIEWVFFDTKSALTSHLKRSPGWRSIYADQVATILVRNRPENPPRS